MISKEDFNKCIALAQKSLSGVVRHKMGETNDGDSLYLVFGWKDGYEGNEDFQKEDAGVIYTLCAKLAFNIDDLQCDYDIDWVMPWDNKGDVYDTDMAVSSGDVAWYNDSAEDIINKCNKGELEYK